MLRESVSCTVIIGIIDRNFGSRGSSSELKCFSNFLSILSLFSPRGISGQHHGGEHFPQGCHYIYLLQTQNEVADTTAAVLMVDKYGGKDTPGNMAVNTRLPTHALWATKFWHRALLLTTTTISSRLAPGRCMADGIRHSRLVHQVAHGT